MDNDFEIIGIDHGWSMVKTSSQVFVTGVKEITTEPGMFDDVLERATGFKMPKVQIKYEDPFIQAEYVYSLIESEVNE